MRHFRTAFLMTVLCMNFALGKEPGAKPTPFSPQQFQAAASEIPQALLAKNIKKIGSIDLKVFQAKMAKVQVEVAPWTEFHQSAESKRIGAQWRRERTGSTITVNERALQEVHPVYYPALALHEYLGVLGYNDESYELSSSMWLLAQETLHKSFSPQEIQQFKKHIESKVTDSNGGVIGVGGGGDFMGPMARLSILRSGLEKLEKDPSDKAGFMESYELSESIAGIEGSWGFDPNLRR